MSYVNIYQALANVMTMKRYFSKLLTEVARRRAGLGWAELDNVRSCGGSRIRLVEYNRNEIDMFGSKSDILMQKSF